MDKVELSVFSDDMIVYMSLEKFYQGIQISGKTFSKVAG